MAENANVPRPGPIHYRLTNEEWIKAVRELTPAQKDVLYYLRTLDPFGNTDLQLGVRDIARILGCNPSTVSRALKVLDQKGFIDLELINVQVRVKSCGKLKEKEISLDKECCSDATVLPECNKVDREATPLIATQHLNADSDLKPLPGGDSENGDCTNNKSNLLKQQNTPTRHPVLGNEQEGIGTIAQWIGWVEAAGIKPNKTIQRVIGELERRLGPAAAAQAVENAVSAVVEQREQGNLRNPGGMLVAALRRGFTANQAKREAREPRPAAKPEPPDLQHLVMAIDLALLQRDRGFALQKLQDLWRAGWHEQTAELIQLRKDWRFRLTDAGVQDRDSE